jgi:hypothetical protein
MWTPRANPTATPGAAAGVHPNYPASAAPRSIIEPGIWPTPRPVSTPRFPAGATRLQIVPRPAQDDTATADTAGIMAHVVRQDSQAPAIAQATAAAIAGIPAADTAGQLLAIFRWIKARVTFSEDADLARQLQGYEGDPNDTEVLIRPVDLLRMTPPQGDCDDFSMLAAAMMRAAGMSVALVTIAADPASPNYSHVYAMAHTAAGNIAMDTSHGPRPAWFAPATGKAHTWELDPPMQTLRALPTWADQIIAGGLDIAKMQATPQGYYQGADGTVYRLPDHAQVNPFTNTGASTASAGTLWVLLIAGVILFFIARRKT